MEILISIIAFIVIFSLLVLIHELGHFMMAKKAGIKVEEFGIGLPPRAITLFKKGETKYTLNWIPFGGFVRMLGEDDYTGKKNKDPRSFQNKTILQRFLVIVAGVFMNFVLAVVLLTIGFSFGMQPIMINSDDVISNIRNGSIEVQENVIVKNIEPGSIVKKISKGDSILSVNGEKLAIVYELKKAIENNSVAEIQYSHNNKILKEEINFADHDVSESGITYYDYMSLPVIRITENKYKFLAGDIILKINNKYVFGYNELQEEFIKTEDNEIQIIRDNKKKTINLKNNFYPLIVYDIEDGSIAQKSGLQPNDIIKSVNGINVYTFKQYFDSIKSNKENELIIIRSGAEMVFNIRPDEQGKIGVIIVPQWKDMFEGISYYNDYFNYSVINSKPVPFYSAPIIAISETYRLTKTTVSMFGDLVSNLFRKFDLPKGVTGPVGIWKLTDHYAREGLIPLIRLAALLSLSLAVINIMPFPALDGGRLVFIIYELITGKKANQKIESILHMIGFLLLITLLIIVTWSDIMKLFG